MTLPVRFRPEVRDDVREAFLWYEAQRPGLGWEFSLCVEDAIERVRDRPESFPLVERLARRAAVRRFPYGVYFVIAGDHIMVTAVMHSHRDPTHWRDRSGPD